MVRQLFRGLGRKAGLSPGSLPEQPHPGSSPTALELLEYGGDFFEQRTLKSADEAVPAAGRMGWLRVRGLGTPSVLQDVGRTLDIHPLILEDAESPTQRPRLETSSDFVFLAMQTARLTGGEIRRSGVSLFLRGNLLVSFEADPQPACLEQVAGRIREGLGRIRGRGSDYLFYALCDSLVDSYLLLLEQLGEPIERMHAELLENPETELLLRLQSLRTDAVALRRSVWPLREAVAAMSRETPAVLGDEMAPYLRDLYDHAVQVLESVEILREVLTGMVDTYLSSVSLRMNKVMQVLTIVATIFIPLTFIAGIYGMNFHSMPELGWSWGYYGALGLMTLVALGMLAYFRRKGWL
jgi:magnesium transporter